MKKVFLGCSMIGVGAFFALFQGLYLPPHQVFGVVMALLERLCAPYIGVRARGGGQGFGLFAKGQFELVGVVL